MALLTQSAKSKVCEECGPSVGTNVTSEAYIDLSQHRMIFLSEEITKSTADQLAALLYYYNSIDEKTPIKIYINSPGGDSAAYTYMYDSIHMVKSPVQTICIGRAYSAGALLLAAGTAGMRCALKNSQIMIHGVQSVFPDVGDVSIKEGDNYFNYLENHNSSILGLLSKHTKVSIEKIKSDCKGDVWFTAEEALAYGIIDYVVDDISQILEPMNYVGCDGNCDGCNETSDCPIKETVQSLMKDLQEGKITEEEFQKQLEEKLSAISESVRNSG